MSQHDSNTGMIDVYLENKDHLSDAGQASAIRIPLVEINIVFHIISVMIHLLQMKGLFSGQAHEDTNLHLTNFVKVCSPFDMPHISQESIRLCLFLFSLIV